MSNFVLCLVSDLLCLNVLNVWIDLFTGGVQHEVGGEGEDDGEDDSRQGEGDVGVTRAKAEGDQRVEH